MKNLPKNTTLDKDMQDWLIKLIPGHCSVLLQFCWKSEQRNLWDAKPETKAELQKLYLSNGR